MTAIMSKYVVVYSNQPPSLVIPNLLRNKHTFINRLLANNKINVTVDRVLGNFQWLPLVYLVS